MLRWKPGGHTGGEPFGSAISNMSENLMFLLIAASSAAWVAAEMNTCGRASDGVMRQAEGRGAVGRPVERSKGGSRVTAGTSCVCQHGHRSLEQMRPMQPRPPLPRSIHVTSQVMRPCTSARWLRSLAAESVPLLRSPATSATNLRSTAGEGIRVERCWGLGMGACCPASIQCVQGAAAGCFQ